MSDAWWALVNVGVTVASLAGIWGVHCYNVRAMRRQLQELREVRGD